MENGGETHEKGEYYTTVIAFFFFFFLTSLKAFSNFLAEHLHPQWLEAVCIHLPLCGSNIVQTSI